MAQKTPTRGVAGAGPVMANPRRVRNVVLVGHSGAGKTTLVEALLTATGVIDCPGSVVEGTTVCDVDPSTVTQQRSVSLAAVSFRYGSPSSGPMKINLPLNCGDDESVTGLLGLVDQQVHDDRTGYPVREPDAAQLAAMESALTSCSKGSSPPARTRGSWSATSPGNDWTSRYSSTTWRQRWRGIRSIPQFRSARPPNSALTCSWT